jgi:PPOX class probable F420-dependent enzyme
MAETIDGRVAELIEDKNFVQVATIRKDGTPHVVPVWVDHEEGKVVLNSSEGRVWPANLRRDPRVTLNVVNQENPYEYVEIRGRMVEDTHEGADEHIDKLAKKYMGVDEYPGRFPGEQRIIFRIEPERVRHNAPR